jgi:rifampicin phosphotransferase
MEERMNAYILGLSDKDATLDLVGGKGASLARLARAGLPVPGGYHVTTLAYRRFAEANDLRAATLAAAGRADPSVPESLERAASEIGALFDQAPVPEDVAEAIRRAYAELGDATSVAIRSSATAEDLPEASFAGQQESYLNVSGAEAVLDATRKCWASLWTARAIAYRARHGIDSAGVSLAVVVQRMVMAEAAGILFSANPVTGARDEAMITASWGLGEAVVGGKVTPDTVTVAKDTGQVVHRDTAEKQVMTVPTAGGTTERAVPEDLRRKAVLTDRQTAALAAIAVRIESLYGTPMDIEWTLSQGDLAIVQARPITTLPDEAAAALRWDRPDPGRTYMRGSMAEFIPQPMSPLFASMGVPMANRATEQLFRELGGERLAGSGFSYDTINGYAYAGIRMTVGAMVPYMIAVTKVARKMLSTGEQRWREQARPAYVAATRAWEGRALDDLPPSELVAGVREILWAAMKYYTVIQSGTIPSASSSEVTYARLYNLLIKRADDPDATALLFGFDSAPILAEKALFDLAVWCGRDPGLRSHLLTEPAERLAEHRDDPAAPVGVADEVWSEWRARLRAYLDEHGRTTYDLDFARPVPVDSPAPVLEALKRHVAGTAPDPYERQRASVRLRDEATRRIEARLDPVRRRLFQRTLRWAQRSVPLREDSIAGLGIGYAQMRRLLAEVGARFATAGAVERADDVYWLTEPEIEAVGRALASRARPEGMVRRVAERRAKWAAARLATAPTLLPETSRLARIVPGARRRDAAGVLKGVGSGGGQTTARACVLRGPEDFGAMRPGDVLVAVTTTPAWTPLFAIASAVVTDIGGPLSHSSIVAREYGIPAVMGGGDGTRLIRTGQTVTVDGIAGTVVVSRNGH